MSTYITKTFHPKKKKPVDALWIDDYFGPHRYGVQFLGEKKIRNPEIEDTISYCDGHSEAAFIDFDFFKDAPTASEPVETVLEEIFGELESEAIAYRNSRFLAIEISDGDEFITTFKDRKEMDDFMLGVTPGDKYIAYDFETCKWFVPVVEVTIKQLHG